MRRLRQRLRKVPRSRSSSTASPLNDWNDRTAKTSLQATPVAAIFGPVIEYRARRRVGFNCRDWTSFAVPAGEKLPIALAGPGGDESCEHACRMFTRAPAALPECRPRPRNTDLNSCLVRCANLRETVQTHDYDCSGHLRKAKHAVFPAFAAPPLPGGRNRGGVAGRLSSGRFG